MLEDVGRGVQLKIENIGERTEELYGRNISCIACLQSLDLEI
jgi:hypothetical protein